MSALVEKLFGKELCDAAALIHEHGKPYTARTLSLVNLFKNGAFILKNTKPAKFEGFLEFSPMSKVIERVCSRGELYDTRPSTPFAVPENTGGVITTVERGDRFEIQFLGRGNKHREDGLILEYRISRRKMGVLTAPHMVLSIVPYAAKAVMSEDADEVYVQTQACPILGKTSARLTHKIPRAAFELVYQPA